MALRLLDVGAIVPRMCNWKSPGRLCPALLQHSIESSILETKALGLRNGPKGFFNAVKQDLGER